MLSYLFVTQILVHLARALCTAEERLYWANQVPVAYSKNDGTTYDTFNAIPFGAPDHAGVCATLIYPNGGNGVPASVTGQGVVNFGTETRQLFSRVTGEYVDFPDNGTTVILTNVTLGVRSSEYSHEWTRSPERHADMLIVVPIPVTFFAHVYLDFNADCRIYGVRAFAQIPTNIAGQAVDIYQLLQIPKLPQIL